MKCTSKKAERKPAANACQCKASPQSIQGAEAIATLANKIHGRAVVEAGEKMEMLREQISTLQRIHGLTVDEFVQVVKDAAFEDSTGEVLSHPPQSAVSLAMAAIIDRMMAKAHANPFNANKGEGSK